MNSRRIVDVLMTLTLMLLMSMQITEQSAHEYLGIFMFALFLIHQYLNRRWYWALFRGRYTMLRAFSTLVNISLLFSFVMTGFSGIIMSENFPALNIESLTSFARLAHLSCSYTSFVLMGVHLGLHWGMIAGRIKTLWPSVLSVIMSGYGLFAFLSAGIFDYITLRNQFAFIDYEKNFLLVMLDNVSMFVFWTSAGYQGSKILIGKYARPCIMMLIVIVMGVFLYHVLGSSNPGGF